MRPSWASLPQFKAMPQKQVSIRKTIIKTRQIPQTSPITALKQSITTPGKKATPYRPPKIRTDTDTDTDTYY